MNSRLILFILALLAGLSPCPARAHCPVSYEITGPGGLFWEINLSGNHYDGVLPEGTTAQFGPITTWVDIRDIAQTTGTLVATHMFTDGANWAACPPLSINLDGPPQCDEDPGPGARTNHPSCTIFFTAVQTAPGVYSCNSSCQANVVRPPQAYTPPPAAPATLTALNPSSIRAGSGTFTLAVSGSGFAGASLVQWNGTPLTTTWVDGSNVVALVPATLAAAPASASITVWIPGATSAPLSFTLSP